MKYRFSCVISSIGELTEAMESALAERPSPNSFTGTADSRSVGSISRDDCVRYASISDLSLEELLRLCCAWAQGNEIPWRQLHGGDALTPLSGLPTYPFRNTTYWTPSPGADRGNRIDLEPAKYRAEPGSGFSAQGLNVRNTVESIVKAILDYDDIKGLDAEANFTEMGFSSTTIVEFAAELGRAFALPIAETAPFDHPNITALARHIASLRNERAAVDSGEKQPTNQVVFSPSDGERDESAAVRDILSKIADGKLTVDEAAKLIN
jgi:acyl carrier protein